MAIFWTIFGVVLLLAGAAIGALGLLSVALPRWGNGGPDRLDHVVTFAFSAALALAGLALIIAN